MNLKFLAAPVLAVFALASTAMAATQIIDKTEQETTIAVSDEIVSCNYDNGFQTYINIGKPRSTISLNFSESDLSWLPVLNSHWSATVTKWNETCPALKDIVGPISEDGKASVKISRVLQKVTPTTYGCRVQRLDEKITLTFSTGVVLTSRASHSLNRDCDQF